MLRDSRGPQAEHCGVTTGLLDIGPTSCRWVWASEGCTGVVGRECVQNADSAVPDRASRPGAEGDGTTSRGFATAMWNWAAVTHDGGP